MIDSLVVGMKALSRSANLAMDEEEEELSLVEIAITIVLATLLAVLLFIVVPTGAVHALRTSVAGVFLQNVVEGIIRIAVFLAYVWAISRMEDIDRVFMYHGAEHKAIHTYEHGEDLTVDNAQKVSYFSSSLWYQFSGSGDGYFDFCVCSVGRWQSGLEDRFTHPGAAGSSRSGV